MNGNLYTIWQDIRFNGIEEIAFSMSSNGTFTWTTPVKTNRTPDNVDLLRQQAFLPSVAVTGEGTVGVSSYGFRNDDDTGELADHWLILCTTNCSDPGNWAGSEVRLTDTSFDYRQAPFARGLFLGDHVGLAADESDFLAFFQQSSVLDSADGFFRRVTP